MKAKFIGGPLDGQKRCMDVYLQFVPVPAYGYDGLGRPKAYYRNVLPSLVGKDMKNQLPTEYVFYIDGVMHAAVSKTGEYVS